MRKHKVSKGECLATIAASYGFKDWRTIYTHGSNAEFRQLRKDPNVILPGDRLNIPDPVMRKESAASGQRHSFIRKTSTTLLRLVLKDEEGQTLADQRYRIEIEDQIFEGEADGQGLVEIEIPTAAEQGTLLVWMPPRPSDPTQAPVDVDYVDREDPGDSKAAPAESSAQKPEREKSPTEQVWEHVLLLGHLDPAEKLSGVQARLANLGFNPGPIDGINGDWTKSAVRLYQISRDLREDGIAGANTQAALLDEHGC